MNPILHRISTETNSWRIAEATTALPASNAMPVASLQGADTPAETWEGFGGCFNELGWQTLRAASPATRTGVLNALFGADGLNLDLGRIPMGASDYASEWHSYTEKRDDFALDSFSIARDQTELLPYIKEAVTRRPDMRFFASPWSPPTWMKSPSVYNFGRFRMEPRYLETYARYFVRFIDAYRTEGIDIGHVYPQNEPVADQKFPSCLWSGEQLREFIGAHLGPVLANSAPKTRVWLGTMNTDEYIRMFLPVLSDPVCLKYLGGIGLQWTGKGVAHRLRLSHPDMKIWQTENECGDGQNTWDYAHFIFDLINHYLSAGCSGYAYWNMVLAPGGVSSWGWKQNAMITVDPATDRWSLNPEYHVMKHFCAHVRPGYRRIPLHGSWAGAATAFARPEGGAVLITHNPGAESRLVRIKLGTIEHEAVLPPRSFNTLLWEK
jgi:glucosylceramidase